MADYGTPINQTKATAKRNSVGEADPETRRKRLAEALKPGPAVKTPVSSASTPDSTEATLVNAYQKLKGRGKQVDKTVDAAQ